MLERAAQHLGQIVQRDAAVHPVAIALLTDRRRLTDVVFVMNLAHDFLEDVLERDQARRAAELVHHDREMRRPTLEIAQLAVERLGLGHVGGGSHEGLPARRNGGVPPPPPPPHPPPPPPPPPPPRPLRPPPPPGGPATNAPPTHPPPGFLRVGRLR